MGSKGKIFVAASVIVLAMNYSKLVRSSLSTVKRSVGTIELTRIDGALKQYNTIKVADAGTYGGDYYYPKDQAEFEQCMLDSFDTAGRDVAKDQWGNPFIYKPYPDGYLVTSMGADGKAGTEDDLWLERHGRNTKMDRGLAEVEQDLLSKADEVAKAQEELLDALESEADKAGGTAALGAAGAKVGEAASRAKAMASEALGVSPSSGGDPGAPPPGDPPLAASAAQPGPPKDSSPPAPKLTPKQERKAQYLIRAAKNMALNDRLGKARAYYARIIADYPGTAYASAAAAALDELPK